MQRAKDTSQLQATARTLAETFAANTLYALALELLDKQYETRWTWAVVTLGVAGIGGGVARRFAGPLPALEGRKLVWWAWRQMFYHSVAAGIPIVAWQIWQDWHLQEKAKRLMNTEGDAP